MTAPGRQALRARRILAGPELAPLDGGWIVVAGGRIVAVSRDAPVDLPPEERRDLGDVVLAPGLVNAHTHLELSLVPWVGPGTPFPAFLEKMRAYRGPTTSGELGEAAAAGARECLATGTTAVADLATCTESAAAVAASGLEGLLCAEILGLDPGRVDAELGKAMAVHACVRPGLAPGLFLHAPYSVGGELQERARSYARQAKLRLATHLLESPEEIALLTERRGALHDLVAGIGLARFLPEPQEVAEIVRRHARDTLLVHLASCPEPAVAAIPDGAVAVLCPRSNATLGVGPAPFAALERRGVTLALGTDSRASAPSLDLREEMRAACAAYGISPRRALGMATLAGAAALGAPDLGLLAPGSRASFLAVADGGAADPSEALLDPGARVVEVQVSGRRVA